MTKQLSYLEKTKLAWGENPPDWIKTLATECDKRTGARVSAMLQYSNGVVSAVIANAYKGDLAGVEAKVRGAFMNAKAYCPAWFNQDIDLDYCLQHQKRTDHNGLPRALIYRHCRGLGVPKCEYSRIPDGKK